MNRDRLNAGVRRSVILLWLLLAPLVPGLAQESGPADAHQSPAQAKPTAANLLAQQMPPITPEEGPPSLPSKQRDKLLKSNFEKMKEDATELAKLAKSLQEDLDKSNANVLSLDVVEKAERIEKLAKRIRSRARGY